MELVKLSHEASKTLGATHRLTITWEDVITFTSGTATPVIPASGTNPPGLMVENVFFYLETPFDGGSTTGLTFQLGDGGDVDRLINNQAGTGVQVHLDGTEVLYYRETNASIGNGYVYTAADTIDAIFTVAGAAITALTAGKLHVFLRLVELAKHGDVIT